MKIQIIRLIKVAVLGALATTMLAACSSPSDSSTTTVDKNVKKDK